MCNDIYVPKDAFIVKDENTTFTNAKPSRVMIERYDKYFYTLIEQGYKREVAKSMADDRLKLCFKIFMARYSKKNSTNEK